MIIFLFVILCMSTILTVLSIFDESPLAEAIDLLIKGLVVIVIGLTLLGRL